MFVDFTSEDTREKNWKEMLKENVLEYGTSSVWNDNCEYDSMVDKDSAPEASREKAGPSDS